MAACLPSKRFESSHSDVAKALEIIEVSGVLLFERKDSFQAESSTLVQLALEIQQKNGQITLSGDQARLRYGAGDRSGDQPEER